MGKIFHANPGDTVTFPIGINERVEVPYKDLVAYVIDARLKKADEAAKAAKKAKKAPGKVESSPAKES